MDFKDQTKQILDHFPIDRPAISEQAGELSISANKNDIFEICTFLKQKLHYDYLQFLTCIDRSDKLEMRYYLYSYAHKGTAIIKTDIERLGGKIRSVSSVWKTADWHEREAYDLFGVIFDGHPDLKRILLEDDFEGHPLLKDFSNKNLIRLPKV